ncbi:MAG: sulfatase, partial [Myxococcales bacterium]|nr:sulfatase [Myxococcales bacterium]
GYAPEIEVEDRGREDAVRAELQEVQVELPELRQGLGLGLGAGLLAGLLVGVGEASVVLLSGSDTPEYSVLFYGGAAYALLLGAGGAGAGLFFALSGRLIRRQAFAPSIAFSRLVGLLVALPALALTAFRIRRDIFHEELVWKSRDGLLVLGGCLLVATLLYFALSLALRALSSRRAGAWLLRSWGAPALVALLLMGLWGGAKAAPGPEGARAARERVAAPAMARDVLVIVVDTLRADRLPSYGYAEGETPNLEAFAEDAIRFDQAFANASWTRPSFASILTGRFARSHRVMSKADALPDELETMAEAFAAGGYHTAGIATNYNVAPFFNFHQGFDEYTYLEPEFVLGANDTDAKLLLVQVMKRIVERFSAAEPGGAYQDAPAVNRALLAQLDRAPSEGPRFFFTGYMDPHDPYFEHPYSGPGYSRATHQHPDPSEAPRLSALYDGEITFWDEHFGALIAELQERGLYEQMTIVVTADHGEEFMEHGGFWHGTSLYDEQVRVPLLIKLPFAERGGSAIEHWVQLVDLMPTLLARNGLPEVEGVQGGDLFVGTSEVYAEESHEGNILESLRTRRGRSELKIITANENNPRGLPTLELFRVDQDPLERVSLGEEQPEIAAIASRRLELWSAHANEGAVERQAIEASDPEAVARLRALGYAGAEGEDDPDTTDGGG